MRYRVITEQDEDGFFIAECLTFTWVCEPGFYPPGSPLTISRKPSRATLRA